MSEANNGSGTLTRTTKQSDSLHPHYFSSFQNYCCGPKAKTASSSSNRDFLPIPEKFKLSADEVLNVIHRLLVERIRQLTENTSVLPRDFFESERATDLQRYLIDRTMLRTMNEARVINWMSSLKKLYPVRTSGNGNCLLHAVLIAMVGTHDFNLHLRDLLVQFMDRNKNVIKSIWKAERLKTDKQYGIQSEDSKLDIEWEELCDLVRYDNSDDGQTASSLQFLEGVHIFSVSNMLSRPIIILSEDVVRNKHGEPISVNDLYGIYLPILSRAQDCVAQPIVLAYDQSHFCPLQTSDLNTGASSDNYLPLYQSIDHISDQKILPIRFLSDDTNPEMINKTLQNYLRIKKLSYYSDAKSAPISVVCAELGNKCLPEKNNFYLVYYNYIMDFYETQKRRSKEEDEYYYSNPSSHDTTQRSLINMDDSSSPSPPPPYTSKTVRTNETTQKSLIKLNGSPSPPPYSSKPLRSNENRNNLTKERRPSYEKAVADGTFNVAPNDNNRFVNEYSEPQKPQPYVQITQRRPPNNDTYRNNAPQYHTSHSNWEPIEDDLMVDNRTKNPNQRGNDSKIKQGQENSVRIPVQLRKTTSPSNLIDFEQKTDRIRPCIVCKHYFEDLLSTGLCTGCEFNVQRTRGGRQPVIIRSSGTNIYPPPYPQSDFITPLTTSIKLRGPQKIVCPHCKNLNMLNTIKNGAAYNCSVCQTILHVPRF